MTDERGRLLTVEEVAARLADLGLPHSRRRVRKIPARELPYLQLEARGRRAYAERDVLEFLERRTIRG